MSDRATTWAWQQKVSSDKARLAMLYLANNSDEDGVFSLKRKEFAAALSCSLSTVDRRVALLVEERILIVETNVSDRGFEPNTYRLAIPEDFARVLTPSRKTAATFKTAATNRETIRVRGEAAKLKVAATGDASQGSLESRDNSEKEEARGRDARARNDEAPLMPLDKKPFNKRWRLSNAARDFATSKGYINGSVDDIYDAFKAHHASKVTLSADWGEEWRKWVLRQVKFDKKDEASGKSSRNDPNSNRRARHRAVERVLKARKMVGQSRRLLAGPSDPGTTH